MKRTGLERIRQLDEFFQLKLVSKMMQWNEKCERPKAKIGSATE
jgi:hypothetical protein